jgi:DNA-binding winged helix-turn-helix (wHTH) protein/tetratricopeptide (TPR) repeat protein
MLNFGPFRLDSATYGLYKRVAGEPERQVTLPPKAFDILRYLVEHPGRVISQDEFLTELWPENYVQPEVLKGHVLAIRTALGDRISPYRYIETVRGRGYRFIADVLSQHAHTATGREMIAELLVGRAEARAELELALSRARAGGTQIVFVTGEAGIGKTALLEAFMEAASVDGAVGVTGHCLPGTGQTDAYYPVLELLSALSRGTLRDSLLALLTRLAPTWLVQLPSLVTTGLSELRREVIDATPHRMARELCDLLGALANRETVVLFLEDLHWADQATLDLLHAIASRKMSAKLMIVASLRASFPALAARAAGTLAQKLALYRLAHEIKLGPLAFDDIDAFLGGFAGAAPPKALTLHLHVRSEGNPLFMRAVLDNLLQRDLVSWGEKGWRLDPEFERLAQRAPPSLAQIIEAEIHDLAPEEQSVLESASISDGPFSPLIQCAASNMDEHTFETVCEAMHRRGQLIRRSDVIEMPDGRSTQTYAFRHSLFQEVAYDRQGAMRRARGHAAVGACLANMFAAELPAIASSLARHFVQAGLWPEAISYLRIAARTAMQRFALREAAASLEQAIALSRHLPVDERGNADLGSLEELARIYVGTLDARAEAAYARLARLARELGRVDVEARALFGFAYVISWTDAERCLEIMSQALAKAAEIADHVQRARLRCRAHGWRSWIQGWSAVDAAGLRTAIEELKELDDPLAYAASLVDYSLILFPAARYREGIEVVAKGFEVLVTNVLQGQVDLSLPLWMTRLGTPWALMSVGQFGEAIEGFASGYAAFETNGDMRRGATLRLFHAFVYERMHDHRAAINMLDETLARMLENEAALSPNETRIELIVRGLSELGLGRVEEAFVHLKAARTEMNARTTLTSWYWRLALEWGMTDAHLAAGDWAAAQRCAHQLLERAGAIEERTWRALAAEACARVALVRGNTTLARSFLARAWSDIDGYDTPMARWRLHSVQAALSEALGDLHSAARHRGFQANELAALAATLPAGHSGRDTLRSAQPLIPELNE